MAAQVAQRAYLKGLTVSFKNLPLEMVGDLVNVTRTSAGEEERFVTVTPDGEPRQVKMMYFDPETNDGPWSRAQCRMAKKLDNGSLVVVNEDEIKAAKQSPLAERRLELEIFNKADVLSFLCSGKTRYVFRPSGSSSLYGILQQFLSNNDDKVLIGRVNLGSRSGEKIVCLSQGVAGHLLIEELVWPEDVNDFATATWPEVKSSVYDMSVQIIESSISTFDAAEWKKESRERLTNLVLSAQGEVPSTVAESAEVESNDVDLEALLAATLESVRNG